MPSPPRDNLTLLIRPGEKRPRVRGLPRMRRVSDPGSLFPGLKKFFRPWRLIGKLLLVGVPCWGAAVMAAVGGWLSGVFTSSPFTSGPVSDPGVGVPTVLALLPFVVLGLWALVVGVKDVAAFGRTRARAAAYREALARLGDADVLTPRDLSSPGICGGLATLGHFERLLASVERAGGRVSGLLRDSLHESRRLVQRSVLDLITTERRIAEWSVRLGEGSGYAAKLHKRRDHLADSHVGILDACLEATDRALADGEEGPADLERSVQVLLDSCQRALAEVERDGPEIDEQELLMYAAKAREAGAASRGDVGKAGHLDRPDH